MTAHQRRRPLRPGDPCGSLRSPRASRTERSKAALGARLRGTTVRKTIVASNAPGSAAVKPRPHGLSSPFEPDKRSLAGSPVGVARNAGCVSSSRCRTIGCLAKREQQQFRLKRKLRAAPLCETANLYPGRTFCMGRTSQPCDVPASAFNRLVEPDGIEPTTSCLQSTRSPN